MTITIPKKHIVAAVITFTIIAIFSIIINSAKPQPPSQTNENPFQLTERFDEPLIMHITPLATLPVAPSNAPLKSVLGEPQLEDFIDPERSITPNSDDEKINEIIKKYNKLENSLKELGVLGKDLDEPIIEFDL